MYLYNLYLDFPSLIVFSHNQSQPRVLQQLPLTVLWNCVLEHYTRYSAKDLKNIISLLVNVLARVSTDESPKKLNVSTRS